MTAPLIKLNDVTVTYDRHPAVHHLSGTFTPGSLTAIAGPNGAGKSTLLKAVMGRLPLASGSIERENLSIRDIGYLPQAAEIDRSFPLTVADTVMLGAWRQSGAFRGVAPAAAASARHALSAVGLEGFERRHIGSLSAGQFQRVLFARLLIQDARTTRDLLELVGRWHQDGRTVIAVLHDFDQVRDHFSETLLMARQLIGWGPTGSTMTPENLLRARAMAEKWDEDAPACAPDERSAA